MDVITGVRELLEKKGRTVHTIEPGKPLTECARIMLEKEVNSLVIPNHGGVAGIITWREVMQVAGTEPDGLATKTVADVMIKNPPTATEDASLREVERLMIETHLRHLPVLKDGELCGIITRIDVLQLHLDHAIQLSSELESFISGVYRR